MFMGTSPSQNIAAPPSWHPSTLSPSYMAPSPTGTSSFTTITDVQVLPFPGLPTAAPSEAPVVINLHADVTIQRYDYYYHTPLSSFRPIYYAVEDGSLLTEVYAERMAASKLPVFFAGALLVFFLRNARKSLVFLRRTRVKDKTLFYLLACSQFLGLMGSVVNTVGLLGIRIDCVSIDIARKALLKLSGDIMITGIIGLKAYRCLGNNRLVWLFLFIMTAITWSLEGLHLASYAARRSRYGVCEATSGVGYVSLIMLADFIETTILCACFSFVVWRSCKMKTCGTLPPPDGSELYERNEAKDGADSMQYPRGWWDYVPDARADSGSRFRQSSRSMKQAFMDWLRRLWSGDGFPPSIAYQRKPSLPGEFPLPQPPRRSPPGSAPIAKRIAHVCYSSYSSVLHRWGRRTSGRQLFQKMLRNELLHTTMIAAIFMAMAIVLLVGVHSEIMLSPEQWIIVNWVIISLCTMHSFSRVVRRHELESVLQHPAAWDRMLRADMDFSKIFYGSTSRRTRSPQGGNKSPSPPPLRANRSDDGLATFRPSNNLSQDGPFSSYTISPLTPSASRKPSSASTIPSLPFRQQSPSLHDSPPRTPTFDTLPPLPYPPPSPTASFSRFSFTPDTHPASQSRPPTSVPSRPPTDSRRFSLDAWTDQRTTIDWTDPNRASRNSS